MTKEKILVLVVLMTVWFGFLLANVIHSCFDNPVKDPLTNNKTYWQTIPKVLDTDGGD